MDEYVFYAMEKERRVMAEWAAATMYQLNVFINIFFGVAELLHGGFDILYIIYNRIIAYSAKMFALIFS